jgi:hypothetical protein
MPTARQDSDFAEEMKDSVQEIRISTAALDSAIHWISRNLDPDDVFDLKQLEDWAESNGYEKK